MYKIQIIKMMDCKMESGDSGSFTIGDRVKYKHLDNECSGKIVGITVNTNPVDVFFRISEDVFKPIEPHMHHMTIEQFIKDINDGCISDDDGFGEYATETHTSTVYVEASEVGGDIARPIWATHVVWYND